MKLYFYVPMAVLIGACSSDAPSVFVTKSCAIDNPVVNGELSNKGNFIVGGWFFDGKKSLASDKLKAQFSSPDRATVKVFDVSLGGARPDVASVFQNQNAESSGFNGIVPAGGLMPGKYEITVINESSGSVVACGNGHTVIVKE